MVLVISTFRVANGLEEQVRRAFRDRPRLVDDAAGFQGLEVFTSAVDSALFYLATRWTDEESFRRWHTSDEHRQSHVWISKGLKLDAGHTSLLTLQRIEDAVPAETLALDAAPVVAAFAASSDVVYVAACDEEGRLRTMNAAFRKLTGAAEGSASGRLLTAGDAEALRQMVSGAKRSRKRRLLNFLDGKYSPHTLSCVIDAGPNGFLVIGEPALEAERQWEDELLRLNNELAVLMRENTREDKALEAANGALKAIERRPGTVRGGDFSRPEVAPQRGLRLCGTAGGKSGA